MLKSFFVRNEQELKFWNRNDDLEIVAIVIW